MKCEARRPGIGRSSAAAGVAAVLVLASLGSYLLVGTGAHSTSSPASSTTSSPSSSAGLFRFALVPTPQEVLIAPGYNETFPTLEIAPPVGGDPAGSEDIELSASGPTGLQVAFLPAEVRLNATGPAFVSLVVDATGGVSPARYSIRIQGRTPSGAIVENGTLSVRVVEYLVFMSGFRFVPGNLTIAQGGTVYWMNLDTGGGGEGGGEDPGWHNVSFLPPLDVDSGIMMQFATFAHTFNQTGTFPYICDIHPDLMQATIVVVGR